MKKILSLGLIIACFCAVGFAGSVQEITKDNFNAEIAEGIVVVDYWAVWCAPCKKLAPKIEELSGKYPKARFFKFKSKDLKEDVVARYKVVSLPAVLVFKDGAVYKALFGADINASLEPVLEQLK
jgi:thioredoxin 1